MLTKIEKIGGKYKVLLCLGNQRFDIGEGNDTIEEAEWTRVMLNEAIIDYKKELKARWIK